MTERLHYHNNYIISVIIVQCKAGCGVPMESVHALLSTHAHIHWHTDEPVCPEALQWDDTGNICGFRKKTQRPERGHRPRQTSPSLCTPQQMGEAKYEAYFPVNPHESQWWQKTPPDMVQTWRSLKLIGQGLGWVTVSFLNKTILPLVHVGWHVVSVY